MSKPICIFQSPMWTRSGYGDLGMALAKSLLRYDKFDVMLVPTRWGGCSRKYLVSDVTDPLEKELYSKIMRQPLNKQPELFIQCTIPNEFQTPAKYNIGITAGIETTIARAEWVEGLNRMNMNIVTSKHAKTVFADAIYKKQEPNQPAGPELKSIKPMEVLFWGADTSIYGIDKSFEPKVEMEFANVKEDFCFLFVGQWTGGGLFNDRKDIGNLIKTFMSAFSNMGAKPKPALIIKTSGAAICNMDKHDMINRLKSVKAMVEGEKKTKDLPNVYLLYGELSESEMNALYNHPKVKAHVSFTHGEGFGHPLLLSTLSGKPLLVSNWSGHLDFLEPKFCKLLDGDVKQLPPDCANEWLIKESSWFTVNYAKAEETMRTCFYYYKAYLEKAEQLRLKNITEFSIEAMDKKFHAMLENYIPKFATETKLILPKLKRVKTGESVDGPIGIKTASIEGKTATNVSGVMVPISMDAWNVAQKAEKEYWQKSEPIETMVKKFAITYDKYFKYLDIPYDLQNKSVIEIGPAKIAGLSYCKNYTKSYVIEPLVFDDTIKYYEDKPNIVFIREPAEKCEFPKADEAWIFNLLQHVIDPVTIINRCKQNVKIIRFFEAIDTGTNEIHPFAFSFDFFCEQFGKENVKLYRGGSGGEEFHGSDCAYGVWESKIETASNFDVKESESPEVGRQNSVAKADADKR